jgi:excisionase family DNA binding protein
MARKAGRKAEKVAEEERLTLDEAAAALGVSRSTLYRWQNQGRVKGFKVGRQWRFKRSDLENFSKMTHPAAASVNVGELDTALAEMIIRAGSGKEVVFDPAVPGYPATEEERAVAEAFSAMLATAAKARASDVHIDAERGETTVRQRVDGVLREMVRVPKSSHGALVSCIKAHAGIPLDQRGLPQDGRFTLRMADQEFDVRTATMPAVYGESVVMRLLIQSHVFVDLERLGMYPEDLEKYRRALRAPVGLLIASGPTGSGKTTVLYSGLKEIARAEVKIMSIEDPVEYALPHVTQVPVVKKAGLTFEAGLRAFLRHDPDIVLAGELRSLESAETAAQIAITGHLMMTVLHAQTAGEAVTRLLDMGLEPFMVTQTLIYVSAQRLARKVCSKCVEPQEPESTLLSALAERAHRGGYELPDSPTFMRGKGCDQCRQTGYHGRTGIYECMEVSREIQRLIMARASAEEIEEVAVRNGMTTLAADGLRKAADGITSVAEAARVVAVEAG